MRYIYPRLYSLHDMPDDAGMPEEETGHIILPPAQNLTSEKLAPHGLYLIDDGQTQFPVSYTHLTLPTICSV